jgi:nitronate monooxygenase
LAPLAGGPSTPELTATVANVGGLAFLAAGYLTPQVLQERLVRTRTLTAKPFGVNVFVPGRPSDSRIVAEYAALLGSEAERLGVELGEPRFEDDYWNEKLDLLTADPVAAVSFTFGCPPPTLIDGLHQVDSEVWVTVTTPQEAAAAELAGADVLVAQGSEAGGHRGTWRDDDPAISGIGVVALVQLVRANTKVPIVAAGGIATGAAIAAVLAVGADAAALGTAFLRCPEAGTSDVHRAALTGTAPTELTRAFTGRMARGIRNRILDRFSTAAPSAYPEVHHLTSPLRQAGREAGDPDVVNLWAGQAYPLTEDQPAEAIVRRLARELAEVALGQPDPSTQGRGTTTSRFTGRAGQQAV